MLVRPARVGDQLCVTSEFGTIVLEWEVLASPSVQPGWEYFASPIPRRWPVGPGPRLPDAYRGTVRHFVRLPPAALYGVAVPHWLLVLATSVLPGVFLLRLRRRALARRLSAAGLCRRCGYDLRASPHRCPECGSAVSVMAVG